ncbi:hypothetical protein L1049_001071 [Liquidambar formosana]|uniref:Potassium channel domain-containing protein n=1 Tax=Liquidambar formosana TaxID=63359 RepID=A0AAP0NCL8_LIQFO
MAYDGAKQPLVSGLLDQTHQTNQKKAPNRKRYRCSESVPQANKVPHELALPRSKSISGKLHISLKKIAIMLAIYLTVGTICFFLVRHQIKGKKTNGIIDSLYLCIKTMTTVGYGDLIPDSVPSKMVACALAFSGMAMVGLILSKAGDYLVEKQERLLVKALSMCQKVGPIETLKEIEKTKSVGYKCVIVVIIISVLMFVGMIFLAIFEELDHIDVLYCVCGTITTLGYGDVSFTSAFGRFFAVFWILSSSTCLSHLFLYIAQYKIESKQRSLVKWVLTWRMANVDLETADVDGDGLVSDAEFIIHKLKEMGRISQEDISLAMEEFENLDGDQSRTLSVSDIKACSTI